MSAGTVVLKRRRRRPSLLLGCVLSLAILVPGWSALWFFARHEAMRRMDQWRAVQAAEGRVWSCPERRVDGFPLHLRVACSAPSFVGQVGGRRIEGELGGVDAEVAVVQPNAVTVHVGGPLTLRQEGAPDRTIHWDDLAIEARLLGAGRVRVAVLAEGLAADDGAGRTNRVRHAALRFAPAPNRPAGDKAYEVWLDLAEAALPALDEIAGTGDPLSVEQKGIVTAVDPAGIEPWRALVERWRSDGGLLTIDTLKLAKGPLKVEARGSVGLDADHRLSGHLQTALSGYEAVAARLGLPLRAVTVGGALANLLGRKAAPLGPAPSGGVALPVVIADGRLSVGPFKTPLRFDPLY